MRNLIQWPVAKYWDRAWNPVIGCRPVSPACENCWAREWAARFGKGFEPHKSGKKRPPRKSVVFCGNMTDLWGEWVTESYLAQERLFDEKAVYLWLTKRASGMCRSIRAHIMCSGTDGLANHYFGITAENEFWRKRREEDWDRVPVPFLDGVNVWLSAEPLLGPLEAASWFAGHLLSWVVVGCESGQNRRPCKVEWVEGIVADCRLMGVPVFVKQLDIGGKCVTDIEKFPEHLRVRQVPWAEKGVGQNGGRKIQDRTRS